MADTKSPLRKTGDNPQPPPLQLYFTEIPRSPDAQKGMIHHQLFRYITLITEVNDNEHLMRWRQLASRCMFAELPEAHRRMGDWFFARNKDPGMVDSMFIILVALTCSKKFQKRMLRFSSADGPLMRRFIHELPRLCRILSSHTTEHATCSNTVDAVYFPDTDVFVDTVLDFFHSM